MSKYTVSIPNNYAAAMGFGSLKKAKEYAKTQPSGYSDNSVMITDDVPGRVLRVSESGNFDYSQCPESWKY